MKYFAKIIKSEGVYLVSFPDLENINTYGETKKDALHYAEEVLNLSIEVDFERGFEFPEPKMYKGKNYYPIEVKPHIQISIELRKLRKGMSQVKVAKKLGITAQTYQRLENPRKCNPTIKTLEKISNVLGKKFEVAFS